jgi:2-polyprenyl-3-methyl-5-hydroxy-6-metoxy-1,4-benzoquinol methylase
MAMTQPDPTSANCSSAEDRSVATYFDRAAEAFDGFYDGKRGRVMRWVDRCFRSDMAERFRIAFDRLGDLDGKSVLDIGCGSGPYAVEAARRGATVLGVDLAEPMIELAGRRALAARVADRCTFRVGSFPQTSGHEPVTCALVMGVMDYIAEPGEFLAAVLAAVTERALLSFPSRHWLRTPLRQVRYWLKRCPVHFYRADQIERLLRDAGADSVELIKIPGAGMDYVAIADVARKGRA